MYFFHGILKRTNQRIIVNNPDERYPVSENTNEKQIFTKLPSKTFRQKIPLTRGNN